jgi:hypothetical protein
MLNSTVSAIDAGLPNLNRRSVLAKLGLGVVSAAVAIPIAKAAPADPIYAAIEEHRAAYSHYIQMFELYSSPADEKNPRRLESADNENFLLWQLVETKPQTIAGVMAFAEYLANYPDIDYCYVATDCIAMIAESLRNILSMEA